MKRGKDHTIIMDDHISAIPNDDIIRDSILYLNTATCGYGQAISSTFLAKLPSAKKLVSF